MVTMWYQSLVNTNLLSGLQSVCFEEALYLHIIISD